jgi:hypothetical protein
VHLKWEENERTRKEDTRDLAQHSEENEEDAAPSSCRTVGASGNGDDTIVLHDISVIRHRFMTWLNSEIDVPEQRLKAALR